MTERITAAEYRALTAEKPRSHGSKRGSTGATTGTCRVCGQRVKAADPAEFRTEEDGSKWVRHLSCKRETAAVASVERR